MAFALVPAAVVGTYSNATNGPFIFDDEDSVVQNFSIRRLSTALEPPAQVAVSGRPLVNLSFALNYAAGGLAVRGYHLVNIALHCFSALIVLSLLGALYARWESVAPARWELALAGALLWALHPLHTECVNYLSQRTTLMMGVFYLLGLYCAQRQLALEASESRIWGIFAVAAASLAMLCKETAVTWPAVVLLLDRFAFGGSWRVVLGRWRFHLAMASSWIVLLLAVAGGPRSGSAGFGVGLGVFDYFRTQLNVVLHYYRLALWPSPLVIDYHDWALARTLAAALPGAAFVGTLLAVSVWGFARGKPWALVGLLPLALLSPTSSIVPILTELVAERRMYLPLLPLVAGAVVAVWWLMHRMERRNWLAVPLVALVASGYAIAAHRRNGDYRDEIRLWAEAVRTRPRNPRAHHNLGHAWVRRGQLAKARAAYEKAVAFGGGAEAQRNLALALERLGERGRALAALKAALVADPKDAETYFALAALHQGRGNAQEAFRSLKRGYAVRRDHVPTLMRLAHHYGSLQRPEQVGRLVALARAAAPFDPRIAFTAGALWLKLGDAKAAVREFRQGLALDGTQAQVWANLALAHGRLGQRALAATAAKRALALDPANSRLRALVASMRR